MLRSAVRHSGNASENNRLDAFIVQVGKLMRHPAYRREAVVSPLLLRHLPRDAGYAWRGEETLRSRLSGAGLDAASLDHLIGNARAELTRLRGPKEA